LFDPAADFPHTAEGGRRSTPEARRCRMPSRTRTLTGTGVASGQ